MGAQHRAFDLTDGAAARKELVHAACQVWTERLDDTARHSNLLHFGDSDPGSLDLGAVERDVLMACFRGEAVAAENIAGPRAQDGLRHLGELSLRHQEELGLATLHIGVGMATWQPRGAGPVPLAPVLLLPVEILDIPGGVGKAIRRRGELQLNPVLAHVLETDHGCPLGRLPMSDWASGPLAELPEGAWRRLRDAAAQVPSFEVLGRSVLGHFLLHHALMLQDLRLREEAMARHPVVAALAGDERAQAALQAPDLTSGQGSEDRLRIVLAADASQRKVVEAVRKGQSCTIEGPPGTGKSQTIGNLIAALVADGQRVLLVAHKRAALEVVQQRLEARGLGHLTLDLFGAESFPQGVLDRVATALASAEAAPPEEMLAQERLGRRRQSLEASLQALHHERSSGMSVFDMHSRILRLPQAVREAGLEPIPGLSSLNPTVARHVELLLADAHDLGDLLGGSAASPWAGLRLANEVAAAEIVDLALRVHDSWRHLRQDLEALQAVEPQLRASSLADVEYAARLFAGINSTLRLYRAEVWGLDLGGLAHALQPAAGDRAGMLWAQARDPRYRTALRQLRSLRRNPEASPQQLHREVVAMRQQRADAAALQGEDAKLVAHPEADALLEAVEAFRPPFLKLEALLGPQPFRGLSLKGIGRLLAGLAADMATLHRIPRALAIAQELERHGAAAAAREIIGRKLDPALWPQAFVFLWLGACLEAEKAEQSDLKLFGRDHDVLQEEIFRLEQRELAAAAEAVRLEQVQRAAAALREHPGQAALVREEAQKRSSHLPVSALLKAAPDVLLSLLPCWLASPIAVTRLIDGERSYFDVVIFDEASQMPVQAAIPAILRASRLVVAGDRHQLPPANLLADVRDEEQGVPKAESRQRMVQESLLERLSFLPAHRLGWHYRSLDEALFAFSNRHIYGDGVVTFPGRLGHGEGLSHILVDRQSVAEDAKAASADAEVRAVLDLVLRHAREQPQESLGVIALTEGQARQIQTAVDEAVGARPDLVTFFDQRKRERFFVKHLDLVQGDERDAVILSIGCGKSDAKSQSFGPLDGRGGERYLNVAITRARRRMTVVSSLGYEDIVPASLQGGVDLLRRFLQFAAMRSERQMATELTDEPVNPFEMELELFQEEVYLALKEAGIDCVPQYGALRHRVDLAARHPEHPGEYLLAIICDQAVKHALPTGREYDRRRQLELLGWRYHRIWASDWAADRDGEIARALAAYRRAAEAGRP